MTQTDTSVLFEPVKIGGLELKNRIVMAPMTRYFSPEGIPGLDVAEYYRRRAEADVGLIISEGTAIDRRGAKNRTTVPDFHGKAPLAGWQRVIDTVHAAGGRMAPQLWHVGSGQDDNVANLAVGDIDSPSGIESPNEHLGVPMSDAAIADTISAYARAAGEARRLGFDTAEIHAAHGYLIDQFFWLPTNARTDRYGGPSVADRARFGAEIIRAVKAAAGEDFPVIIRISQWKRQDYTAKVANTPDELGAWVGPLLDAGADAVHCSQRRYWEPEFPEIDGEGGLNLAGWVKKLTGATTISVGSVGLSVDFMATMVDGKDASARNFDGVIRRIERGEFDCIAVGRALLGDPDWARKVKRGTFDAITGFVPDALTTLY
jgi:2,4-dienoyl-CoA reductase-like NADH-dependent reductase (Old Yellow Enzyme family)